MREIESEAPVRTASAPVLTPISTGKRRGRPANVEETARRAAVLVRVQAGEISNAEAAATLGLTYGAWAGWKALYAKRAGGIATAPRKVGTRAKMVEPAPTVPTSDLTELVARLERVQKFGAELRRRVRDLVAFVEERAPG